MQFFGRRFAAACIAFAAALPLALHAELVRRTVTEVSMVMDVTADTATGLDWLDRKLTVNNTFDQVRTGPYYQLGFRHATRAEVDALFTAAGTPNDNYDTAVTYPGETVALIDLLGETRSSFNSRHSTGFVGTDFLGNDITLATHPIGMMFSALLGKVDYMDLRPYSGPLVGEAHFTQGHPFSTEASPSYGSFLVRPSGTVSACRQLANSPELKCDGQGRGFYR